jgi:hypothetical protein
MEILKIHMICLDMDEADPQPEDRIRTTTIQEAFFQMKDLMNGRILNILSLPSMRSPSPGSMARYRTC